MSDAEDLAGLAALVRETAGLVIRRVRHESGVTLTWSQSALLSELSRRGHATASELAKDQGLRVQTVWASLETLEKRARGGSERDTTDRRHVKAHLTELGHAELAADRQARDTWIVGALTHELDADERARLADGLALLDRLAASHVSNASRATGPSDAPTRDGAPTG
jgi:DNA-binding MarR family transcriptional regulator